MGKLIRAIIILVLIFIFGGLAIYFYFNMNFQFIPGEEKLSSVEIRGVNSNFTEFNLSINSSVPGLANNSNNSDVNVLGISELTLENQTILPNFNESDCGFYFQGYGVCAGKCPAGICMSRGRSCYCQPG